MKFKSNIEIQAGVEAGGSTGSNGQVLSSTGSGVAWINQGAATLASDFVFFNVKNETGSTILKGKGVMAVGTDGNSGHILIEEMVADGTVEAKYFLGVLEENIANGGFARVISFGQLDQFNTSGQNGETWNDGQILWCDPANPGDFTITEPDGPNVKIAAAFILNSSTNGKIQIRVQANEGIHDLHDTKITSQVDGDVLVWDNTTGVWFNDSTLNVDYTNSRVGIGTTSPQAPLHVLDDNGIIIGDSEYGNGIQLKQYGGGLTLRQVSEFGSSDTFRVDINGNVGIGTTSPGAKLEVNAASGDGILIKSADVATLKFKGSGSVSNWGFASTNLTAGDFGLYESNSVGGDPISAGSPRIMVIPGGNVGIGTNSPGEKLDVDGTVKASTSMKSPFYYSLANTNFYLSPAGTSRLSSLEIYDGGVNYWYRLSGNAHQRADARLDDTSSARLHWFGRNDAGDTGIFRHAWYDGSEYFNVTAIGQFINFDRAGDSGHITSDGSFRAPIFYDLNNTGYYLDPASTSNLNSLNVATINRNPVVTLSGDVTGSATMTNLGSINITTTVNNDSHAHSFIQAGGAGPSTEDLNSVANSVSVGQLSYRGYNSSSTNKPPASDNANGVITVGQHSGNYNAQLAFSSDGNMYWRDNPGSVYGSWRTLWDSSNLTNLNQLTNGPGYVTSSGNTVIGTDSDINTSGSTIIDNIYVTDGVITSMGTRALTLGDLGYTGATNANYITNNNQLTNGAGYITSYVNTTYNFSGSNFTSRNSGNPIAVDSATSNTVGYTTSSSAAGYSDGGLFVAAYNSSWVSQIFSNFRTGEISVRGKNNGTWQPWRFVYDSGNLSLSTLGYTGATNANYITNNNQLTNGASYLTTTGKAADSNLLDGLDLHTGRNNEANKVVRTNQHGYADFGWINTTSGVASGTPTRIYCSQDSYLRYYTPASLAPYILNQGSTKNSHTHAYLPLSGGTMSGDIIFNNNIRLEYSSTHWITPRDSSGNMHLKANTGGIYLDTGTIHLRNAGGGNDSTVSNGIIQAYSSSRAPIFYDSNNTGYYVDGASTSSLNSLNVNALDIGGGNIAVDTDKGFVNSGAWTRNQTPYGYIAFGPANTGHAHIYTDRSNFYFDKYIQVSGGSVINTNDIRANIFYDKQNTGYYLDPNGTSNLSTVTAAQFNGPLNGNATTATKTKSTSGYSHAGTGMYPFYNWGGSNGGASAPTASSYTTGISVGSHPNDQSYGFQLANNMWNPAIWSRTYNSSFSSWTQLIDGGSADQTKAGVFQSNASLRAPIFYDSNNTAFYCDPSSTSYLSKIWARGATTGNAAPRWDTSFHVAQSQHFYAHNSTQAMYIGESNTINIRSIGIASGSLRAPIFYDSNNTGYYVNPASTSNLNVLTLAGTATASNFILSSDERKKTKIKDLSCDNIDTNWKSFEMKNNEGEYRVGVIAQELEIKHPEFVNTDNEGFKSVKYIDLLIAKIAELEARLEKAGI